MHVFVFQAQQLKFLSQTPTWWPQSTLSQTDLQRHSGRLTVIT